MVGGNMEKFKIALALNNLIMALPPAVYDTCKPYIDTIYNGLLELYEKLDEAEKMEDDGK